MLVYNNNHVAFKSMLDTHVWFFIAIKPMLLAFHMYTEYQKWTQSTRLQYYTYLHKYMTQMPKSMMLNTVCSIIYKVIYLPACSFSPKMCVYKSASDWNQIPNCFSQFLAIKRFSHTKTYNCANPISSHPSDRDFLYISVALCRT